MRGVRRDCTAIVLALAIGVLVSGCERSIGFDPDEFLESCSTIGTIKVEELDTGSPPSCVPVDSTLVFPTGQEFRITSGISEAESTGYSYSIYNFEKYGIAAGMEGPDGTRQWWGGTAMAIDLGRYFAGETRADPRGY